MDVLFEPLHFRNLTIKNRIVRSNVSGRFDNYDGSGNPARINWELKFARGVGAIISSFVPVSIRGRIIPGYATIHRDAAIPFWRELGERVHEHDCRFVLQLSHAGRQRDIGGIEFATSLSSTGRREPLHGFETHRMTRSEIAQAVEDFAQGARRAREAGLDGVELHAANGYLFTQFLSSAINDRDDDYGGSLANRARFLLDVVHAIRQEVGRDFHLQVKINVTDYNNAVLPWEGRGNTRAESVAICRWLEAAGVDAIHASTGSLFPHPRNPAGELPTAELTKTYDTMVSSGRYAFRNLVIFRTPPLGRLFRWWWEHNRGPRIEGINLSDARAVKQAVRIPVLCTGGFQTASVIRQAITSGDCDAVTIARSLIANNDLVALFQAGHDRPPVPCSYCNKCLVNVIENPLGCYDERRFASREAMLAQIMSVYSPSYPMVVGAVPAGMGAEL
jgi:2,4-dienoyl-CoA reductase-like NADH-dependent reductase (Old Yellow Enzyme family)